MPAMCSYYSCSTRTAAVVFRGGVHLDGGSAITSILATTVSCSLAAPQPQRGSLRPSLNQQPHQAKSTNLAQSNRHSAHQALTRFDATLGLRNAATPVLRVTTSLFFFNFWRASEEGGPSSEKARQSVTSCMSHVTSCVKMRSQGNGMTSGRWPPIYLATWTEPSY
jgi:hypothetical protein